MEQSNSHFLVGRLRDALLSGISLWVFAILDLLDQLLCPVFAVLDSILESEPSPCYCRSESHQNCHNGTNQPNGDLVDDGSLERWRQPSDTVHATGRRSARDVASFNAGVEKNLNGAEILPTVLCQGPSKCGVIVPTAARSLVDQSVVAKLGQRRTTLERRTSRWSDCECERCTSWQSEEDPLLYVHVDDKDFLASGGDDISVKSAENNVIFIHGFMSSSSFWADKVMPALPESVRSSHRLFALDIMGFGRSSKPSTSLYTLADHIDMIRRSVLEQHKIQSFHLVAHSMGCTIALALAANYSSSLKSITLIAPLYFPALPGTSPGFYMMQQLAARRIWPLVAFGCSVMSWYEHIGRVVCLVVCRNHRLWEPILKFVHSTLLGKRIPSSFVTDFTRHTHHSAWHTFHNTICNGGYAADYCLDVLLEAGQRVRVIHGTEDSVIPLNGSLNLRQRYSNAVLTEVQSADHATVVFGREQELARELAGEILHKGDP